MMQESVYSRLVLNNNSGALLKKQLYQNLPRDGLVQLLQVTEKQYASIELLIGKKNNKIIETTERVVIL